MVPLTQFRVHNALPTLWSVPTLSCINHTIIGGDAHTQSQMTTQNDTPGRERVNVEINQCIFWGGKSPDDEISKHQK
jgi:hypothetical protein